MNHNRADRKLHMELLKARGSAERIELVLAVRDISDRFESLRRAAGSIGSIADALRGHRRALRWLALVAAALARSRWLRRVAADAVAGARSSAGPIGALALALTGVAAARLLRRRRQNGVAKSQTGHDDETR